MSGWGDITVEVMGGSVAVGDIAGKEEARRGGAAQAHIYSEVGKLPQGLPGHRCYKVSGEYLFSAPRYPLALGGPTCNGEELASMFCNALILFSKETWDLMRVGSQVGRSVLKRLHTGGVSGVHALAAGAGEGCRWREYRKEDDRQVHGFCSTHD